MSLSWSLLPLALGRFLSLFLARSGCPVLSTSSCRPFSTSLSLSPFPSIALPPLFHASPLTFGLFPPGPLSVPPSLTLSHSVFSCCSLCLAKRAKSLKNHTAGRGQIKGRTKEGSQCGEWGSLPSPERRRGIPVWGWGIPSEHKCRAVLTSVHTLAHTIRGTRVEAASR